MQTKPRRRLNGYCIKCHVNGVGRKRAAYGHLICKPCAEVKATEARKLWCVVPMHKSNYFLCTNQNDLHGINNKGGLVK